MSLDDFTLVHVEAYLLVFFRVAGMLMAAPVFGGVSVPKQTKIGLALAVSAVVFPFAQVPAGRLPTDVVAFVCAVAKELFIGLTVGYAVRLIFAGVRVAGQIVGMQMGFAIVNVLDPQSNLQVSIMGHFLYLVAVLIFLAANGHHAVIRAINLSFHVLPVGQAGISEGFATRLVRMSGEIFDAAVRLAAPAIAVLLLAKVALGLIARTVPQMNVFIVGLPLNISLGLLALGASLPLFGMVFREMMKTCTRDIVFLIGRMH